MRWTSFMVAALFGGAAVLLAVGHAVDKEAQHCADNEQIDRKRAGHAVVAALQVAVQEHDQRHGGAVRVALAIGQDLRHIEHLQPADDRGDQRVGQDRADQRQRDREEPPHTAAAVQLRRLKDVGADAHDGGHQHDGGVAEPHQKVHQPDQRTGAKSGAHKVDGGLGQPHRHEDGVDGPVGGKQREEQHGERRGHNQVGQVDDHLEKLFAAQFQPHIGEPVGQQQRDDDLRDEADQPQNQRVARVLEHVGIQQAFVVGQAHKIGPDLLDAGAVILKKAVADGIQQRNEREDKECNKEGQDKQIAPFGIAQMFWFLIHRSPFLFTKLPSQKLPHRGWHGSFYLWKTDSQIIPATARR